MSFESDFLDLMPHTINRRAWATRDAYGKPSYSTVAVSSYRARVIAEPLTMPSPDGVQIVATHTMYVATTDSIGSKDQITYAGSTYRIIDIGIFPDGDGVHHVRLRTKGS